MDSETAKEVAKFGTAAIEFANRVFGGPLEQLGGLAEDQLTYWRARRRLKLAELFNRAREHFQTDSPSVQPQAVPMKILEPIIHDATLEEDPEFNEMWASLLASAADPEASKRIQPNFPAILRGFSPHAARVLDMLYLRALSHRERRPIRPQKIRGRCGLDVQQYEKIIDSLLAFGLLRVPSDIFIVGRVGEHGSPGAADDNG